MTQKIFRLTLIFLGLLMLAVILGGGWAYWQWQSTPTYWQANTQFLEKTKAEQLEQLAQDVENQVLNALSTRRGQYALGQVNPTQATQTGQSNATEEIRLSIEHVNAWLHVRLPQWLANQNIQMPQAVSKLMLHTEQGQPAVAFAYSHEGHEQIVTLVFDMKVAPGGLMTVRLREMRGGKLPLKSDWIADRMGSSSLAEQASALMQGKTFEHVFSHPTDPKRKVRLTALDIQPQGVILQIKSAP